MPTESLKTIYCIVMNGKINGYHSCWHDKSRAERYALKLSEHYKSDGTEYSVETRTVKTKRFYWDKHDSVKLNDSVGYLNIN